MHDHRCAARNGIDAATSSEDLGFRCCHGPPNAAVIKEAVLGQTFERAKISAEDLEKLLAADPRTASLAKDVKFFREPDSANAVVERGTKDKKGFLFTVAPLLWNPVAGAQYLLVSARSGDSTSFVAAFHVAGKDEYLLASSRDRSPSRTAATSGHACTSAPVGAARERPASCCTVTPTRW